MTLSDGATEIALTKIEHAILTVFFDHPRAVVTRNDLLEQCWDRPQHVSARTVDTVLCRMRKKCGMHGPAITTIRNVGYSFVPQYCELTSSAA